MIDIRYSAHSRFTGRTVHRCVPWRLLLCRPHRVIVKVPMTIRSPPASSVEHCMDPRIWLAGSPSMVPW